MRARPTLLRRRDGRERHRLRARHARARAGGRRRHGGDGLPGPRVAAGDERRAGRARAVAREPRPRRPRSRTGGGGGGAGIRHRGPARAAGTDTVRRRATAGGTRRGPDRRAPPAPAGRADLAARPGCGRGAPVAAAAPERGVGDHGPDRRAPPRAVPRGSGQGDRARPGHDRLRRVARRVPRVGGAAPAGAAAARRAHVLACRHSTPAGHGQGSACPPARRNARPGPRGGEPATQGGEPPSPCGTCGSSSTTVPAPVRWRCAIFRSTWHPARWSRCWAATARERARCCGRLPE